MLPRIVAAGASLVAISPEKPDDSMSTAEKNALTFPVLSDVGQKVGKAFGLVYEFTDELRTAYDGFKLDIPEKNGTPGEWSLPLSATYVIGSDGRILFADSAWIIATELIRWMFSRCWSIVQRPNDFSASGPPWWGRPDPITYE